MLIKLGIGASVGRGVALQLRVLRAQVVNTQPAPGRTYVSWELVLGVLNALVLGFAATNRARFAESSKAGGGGERGVAVEGRELCGFVHNGFPVVQDSARNLGLFLVDGLRKRTRAF